MVRELKNSTELGHLRESGQKKVSGAVTQERCRRKEPAPGLERDHQIGTDRAGPGELAGPVRRGERSAFQIKSRSIRSLA